MSKTWVGVIAILAGAMLVSSEASASSFIATGYISRVYSADVNNYAFRLYMTNVGANPLSGCTGSFVYMNNTDGNYDGKMATALTLNSLQKPVSVLVNKNDTTGYCVISDVGAS